VELSMLANVVVSVSSGLVALAALYGLFTWRREITGKAKFDAARNVAFLSLKVSEDFMWVRFPLASSTEATGRSQRENESPREKQILDGWYIRAHRLEILREDLFKLQTAVWEAEIVLGASTNESVTRALGIFRESFGDLASAIEDYFDGELNQAKGCGMDINPALLKDLRQIIYSRPNDDLSKRVEQAKAQILTSVKRYLH